ncbi:hypothetical protein Tco_1470603 [Tanacetum coccineum]
MTPHQKINDWKNKSLSYAGRLELIAYVLAAMQTYWALVVMLPKATIKEINKVLKNFLSNQGKDGKGKDKIAWSMKLVTNQDSLWVKWVNKVKLKGTSFWEMNDSGTWKSLLALRSKVRQFCVNDIGNGTTTSMWYDNWHEIGPLSSFIDNKCLYDARLKKDYSVADMVVEGRWKWPYEWYTDFLILNRVRVPPLIHDKADTVKWKNKKGQKIMFSTKEA